MGLRSLMSRPMTLSALPLHGPARGIGDVVELSSAISRPILCLVSIDIRVIVQGLGYRCDGDPGLFLPRSRSWSFLIRFHLGYKNSTSESDFQDELITILLINENTVPLTAA